MGVSDGAACGPASEAPVHADCKHGREGHKRAVVFAAAAAAVAASAIAAPAVIAQKKYNWKMVTW